MLPQPQEEPLCPLALLALEQEQEPLLALVLALEALALPPQLQELALEEVLEPLPIPQPQRETPLELPQPQDQREVLQVQHIMRSLQIRVWAGGVPPVPYYDPPSDAVPEKRGLHAAASRERAGAMSSASIWPYPRMRVGT